MNRLNPPQRLLLVASVIITAFLVYLPHWNYHLPYHVDEWHHIAESERLGNYGEYFATLANEWTQRFGGVEIGFHFFLFVLSFIFNLVIVYPYLPALWAGLTAGTIFYVVYKKTRGNFLLAWLALLFFTSIKSDVNLLGLWFFTPLTFALPLVLLYLYFLSEGLEYGNRRQILIALGLMALLIPIHSLSVLFALPALIIYLLCYWRYLLKEWKIFSLFLIVPLIGVVMYKYILYLPWSEVPGHLFNQLQFRYGWGVLEVKNSLLTIYSWLGYLLTIVGISYIITRHYTKKYLLYLLLPLCLFIEILFYRMTGISLFSPYQRNLYYLVIGLPILSAIGLYAVISEINNWLDRLKTKNISLLKACATILLIIATIFFVFKNYFQLPEQFNLYQLITKQDLPVLEFVRDLPPGKVMALPEISTTLYALTGHNPIGAIAFYGDKQVVTDFFAAPTCENKTKILNNVSAKYVITPWPFDCGWTLLYGKNGTNIYQLP